MTQYKCENCNELRDSPICPKCGADTHLIYTADAEPAASMDDLVARVSRRAAAAETGRQPEPPRESGHTTEPPPRPRRVPDPPPPRPDTPPPQAPAAVHPSDIVGLDEFHALLDRGTKAVIICGSGSSGKSEIAYGYIRANNVYRGKAQNLTLRATLRTDDALGATVPREVWYQVIDDKRAFLDPSGEFFKKLSPAERQQLGLIDVTEEDFRFVQRAVNALAGIVLVVDLTNALDPRQQTAWRRQEDDLKFVLSALRWLRFDKEARPQAIGVSTNIAQRVSTLPRIDRRVLVLFSKADQLPKFTNQTPLDFARKRLPVLHGALMTHARRFRYDFCNTMIKTPEGGDQAVDPCGVLLPMDWLLDDPFRWLPLQLPTSWIGGGR
jgi:hypothetical protein